MSAALVSLIVFSVILFLLQGLAAIPWLHPLTGYSLRRDRGFYLKVVGAVAVCGLPFAFLLHGNSEPRLVASWGRFYTSILTLQLGLDLLVATFVLMLQFWPKGGAVALAAFQEGVRQPMFWLLTLFGALAMVVSIVLPYNTFGEDIKMVKDTCFAITMMLPAIFGVMSSSISVSEEIEGRTAVTLLSKPVTRREFLLGKFVGIILAAGMMTMFMGWALIWVVFAKAHYDYVPNLTEAPREAAWVNDVVSATFGRTTSGDLLRGIGMWLADTGENLPGLIIGFGQAMTLTAVSVALATRVPMMVNVPACLVVYLLGHLTPIMTEVSRNRLIQFLARLFELLLPGLDYFDVGTAIIREAPPDSLEYAQYTFNVALYALIYTAIAMFLGLILFEDRDVA